MPRYARYHHVLRLASPPVGPSLHTSRKRIASVDRKVLTIEILIGDGKQGTLGHIDIATGTTGRNLVGVLLLGDVALLVLVRLAGSHLGRENTRGEAVDAYLVSVARDFRSQHAGEVDGRAFGGVVGKVVLSYLNHSADGGDVQDGARPSLVPLGRLGQKRQECS